MDLEKADNKRINKAIKLINEINLHEIYDQRAVGIKTIPEIENFNYEELLNYIANLEIPYDVVRDFFNGDITFADLNNVPTSDDWDYLVIDTTGEIYCWTEVCGICYYLKDYNIKWKEYVEPPKTEEQKQKEAEERANLEKLFVEQFKKIAEVTLPNLIADDLSEVKPMTSFKDFIKNTNNE